VGPYYIEFDLTTSSERLETPTDQEITEILSDGGNSNIAGVHQGYDDDTNQTVATSMPDIENAFGVTI
jgi:hypothetical protein